MLGGDTVEPLRPRERKLGCRPATGLAEPRCPLPAGPLDEVCALRRKLTVQRREAQVATRVERAPRVADGIVLRQVLRRALAQQAQVVAHAREAARLISDQIGGKRVRVIECVIGLEGVPSVGAAVWSTDPRDVLPVLH